MDNRFKFRAQTLRGELVYGNLSVLKNKIDHIEPGIYISNDYGMPFAYPVRPETVGQFTGLLDKNGKKIFEGDITEDSTGLCLIMWNVEFASFGSRRNGWAFDHFFGEALDPKDCEIIGNIYENPELLEER